MFSLVRYMTRMTAVSLILCSPVTQAEETGRDIAQRMLDRIGGKAAWAQLNNTVNGSVQHRTEAPTEVYSVIIMDFEEPRFRIDTFAADLNLVRVIQGDDSWRISWSGEVEDLPEESFKQDMNWYQAHIYRTLHRIALDDPALTLRLVDDNLLEVYTGKTRLIWFRLTSDAEPYAFGFWNDEEGSLSGPWSVQKNGIRHPAWVASRDGSWRAAIRSLEVNVPLHASTFARPMEFNNSQN